jgi:hypothetical protein
MVEQNVMTIEEKIRLYTQKLPYSLQEELLDFVQYLVAKAGQQENQDWTSLSLSSAIRDMENEPDLYNVSDIRISFS